MTGMPHENGAGATPTFGRRLRRRRGGGGAQLYTGATENAKMENAKRSKSDGGKPETDTHYRIQCLTKTYDA